MLLFMLELINLYPVVHFNFALLVINIYAILNLIDEYHVIIDNAYYMSYLPIKNKFIVIFEI